MIGVVKQQKTPNQVKEAFRDALDVDVTIEKKYDYYHVRTIAPQVERNEHITFDMLRELSRILETTFINIRALDFEERLCSCDTCSITDLDYLYFEIWWEK